jgi:uncharacterized membrane protein YedE/YeeE
LKRQALAAFAAGLLFAAGLCLSGMADPRRVIGFLDFFGRWDPTLAFVMMGAVGTHALLYRLITRRPAPVLVPTFSIPTKHQIDAPLVLGSALFGTGWGLSGYCPGPAVAALGAGLPSAVVFLVGMLAGMTAYGTAFRGRT